MEGGRVRWGWVAAAACVLIAALFYIGTAQSGTCQHYAMEAGGGGRCETAASVAQVWVAVVAAGAFVTYAMFRALRSRR
ncbi:hypothetical protein [Diaminobutyricimonas aerilata]|nr:hypothetical protein [Diaminobutyricimonas aerilata]